MSKTLNQEKQRIVAEFRKKWANAMNENGMAGTYAILESGLEKDLDTLHAAVVMECIQINHKYAMKSKTTDELDLIEAALKEMLALVLNKDKKE